jgi:predicted nucleotidyltransferase component of viral defense system
MINRRYITQWYNKAPWPSSSQIEQDLVISRALVEIFSNKKLASHLAFRGGTAITKLFLESPLRYSEDIDLVQYRQGPIGDLMSEIRKALDSWLGIPKYKQTKSRVTFYYSFETEIAPIKTMKLKIEINTREHESELELAHRPFSVENGWFSGNTVLQTYALEELAGTKLRALYQRRKGRDLFDLHHILLQNPKLNISNTVHCFEKYLSLEKLNVTRAEFEENLHYKLQHSLFIDDVKPLLVESQSYNPQEAYLHVHKKLISKLSGEGWQGTPSIILEDY